MANLLRNSSIFWIETCFGEDMADAKIIALPNVLLFKHDFGEMVEISCKHFDSIVTACVVNREVSWLK